VSKSLVSSLGDDLALASTELHQFLSIIVLMLLVRLFNVASDLFSIALISCISMPATYALTYYNLKAQGVGKFVIRKNPEPIRTWMYETIALLSSFVMGFIVFVALSGSLNYMVFVVAFITTQVMRLLTLVITRYMWNMGIDIQHPILAVLVSLSVALVGLVGLTLFSTVFPI